MIFFHSVSVRPHTVVGLLLIIEIRSSSQGVINLASELNLLGNMVVENKENTNQCDGGTLNSFDSLLEVFFFLSFTILWMCSMGGKHFNCFNMMVVHLPEVFDLEQSLTSVRGKMLKLT